ncbi:retrovirus-related pol polyprotein from transposon RE2 [Tanacetum coccineum]
MAITEDANASKSSATQSTTIEGDVSYSQKLTTILLNEFNYLPWSRAITIALDVEFPFGFIIGKNTKPRIFSIQKHLKDHLGSCSRQYGNQKQFPARILNPCHYHPTEEVRRKVMINDATTPEARVYYANASLDKKPYKGKHSDLKCGHCNVPGHSMDRCWILHPELKLNFTKDKKGFIDKRRVTNPKAHMATHTTESFSSSPVALLNEFANYLQEKHGQGAVQDETTSQGINEPAALLSKFSSFLSNSNCESSQGKGLVVLEMKDHPSQNVESDVQYDPTFPFQLLSVKKLTSSLNCQALFTPSKVIFQDPVTKRMIGKGFLINGLYYFFPDHKISQGFQAYISPNNEHILWHRRLGHPSESTFSKITPPLPKGMHDCEICHYSKSTRLPFNSSLSKTDQAFEIIHSDVWGPFPSSLNGFKYFITFIDDFSKPLLSRDVRYLENKSLLETPFVKRGDHDMKIFPFPNVEFSSPPSHNATQEHEQSSQDSIERPPDNATQEHENSLKGFQT